MSIWVKDPADTRWFEFDWSQFLATNETIISHTTAVDTNLTKLSDTATATSVSIQVTGGTVGTQSLLTCKVTTSSNNVYQDEKYVVIAIRQTQ